MNELNDEIKELIELGLLVMYDNGLQGMANGPDWYLIPLCNDDLNYG